MKPLPSLWFEPPIEGSGIAEVCIRVPQSLYNVSEFIRVCVSKQETNLGQRASPGAYGVVLVTILATELQSSSVHLLAIHFRGLGYRGLGQCFRIVQQCCSGSANLLHLIALTARQRLSPQCSGAMSGEPHPSDLDPKKALKP